MPTAPGYADCSIELTLTGLARPAFITFGVDPTATDPSVIASSISTAWTGASSLQGITDSQVTLTGVLVSLGTDGTEDIPYRGTFAIGGSMSATECLPPNCAALITKFTSRGGRRGKGRMYLPWALGETQVDERGALLSARVTQITNACTTFLNNLSTNSVPMVLLHGPGKSVPGSPNPVTALQCDAIVSTQRRRLGR
jgi:hypothetical protein